MRKLGLLGTSALRSAAAIGFAVAIGTPAYAQAPEPVNPGGDPCQAPAELVDKTKCPDATTEESPTEDAGPGTNTAADQGEGILVVGSRIRRNQFNTADPINLITRDEATQAGFNSTAEILQSTAVTGGTDQISDIYGGFVVAGGPGVNTISLRGLGTTRTLVLMNGRRVAPAGSRGSVGSADLNVLPNAIIDRIEILNTGASSIYGSDAIAGVINIVTRTRVNGVTLEGNHSIPEHGAGNQRRYSIVAGTSGDRFNISGSVEYFQRDTLQVGDADFARCPRSLYGTNGSDFGAGDRIDPRTGTFECFPLLNGGVTVNTIGTPDIRPNTVLLAPGVPAGFGGLPSTAGFGTPAQQVCNRFRPIPIDTNGVPPTGTGTGLPGFECVGGGFLSTEIRDTFAPSLLTQDLISPVEIYTGYGQVTFDTGFLGGAELYADLLLNRRKSSQVDQRQFTLDYPLGSPLVPASLTFRNAAGQLIPFLGVQAQVPYVTGVRAFTDYGNYENRQTVDFVRFGGGLRGDFILPDWRYDLFLGKTWSDAEYTTDLILADRLAQSMQVTQNANGTFSCTNPVGGCVAAPALTPGVIGGNQGLRGAWFDFVTAPVTGTTAFRESTANLTLDGPLFRLPGGMMQIAVGAEYRKARIDDTPSEESQRNNLYGFTSSSPTRGTDSVWEVFGEVELPIIRESLVHDFTINASARYTEYESYGGQETYKVGALLSPTRWLSLRGSYGTSYRAPALFEQFLGGTSGFLANQTDPCNNLASVTNVLIRERCLSEGLPEDFRQNNSVTVIGLGGAEAGLGPETSKNYTFGMVFQPRFGAGIGDLSVAVDYFNVLVENGVSQLSAAQVLAQCYNNPERTTCDTGLITRQPFTGPGSGQLTVIQSFVNISDAKVEGIDFTVRYSRALGPGRIRLGAAVTQFLERYNRLLPTTAPLNLIGLIENPEWTGTFDASYNQGPWNLRWGTEWVGSTSSEERSTLFAGFPLTQYDLRTRNYFLHSASVRYERDDFGLTLGIRNVFDTKPPTITSDFNQIGFGNIPLYSGYDYRGRTFFVNAKAGF